MASRMVSLSAPSKTSSLIFSKNGTKCSSASPTQKRSTKGAIGAGLRKAGGPPTITRGRHERSAARGGTPAAWSVRGRMRKSSSNVMLQASTGNEDSGLSDSRVLGASPSVSPSLSGKTRSTAKPGSSARLRYTDCQPRVEMAAFSPPGTTIATGSRPPSTGAPAPTRHGTGFV